MAKGILQKLFFLFVSFCFCACENESRKRSVKDYRPALMKQLDGRWHGKGNVMGDSVVYLITGKPILNTMFTEIHMVDVNDPPQYEALVFIGYDSVSKNVFAHWLDSFGGAFSVPHGTGTIRDTKIEFSIPYPTSTFRDTFTFDRKTETWKILINSQIDSLTWSQFASYELTKIK